MIIHVATLNKAKIDAVMAMIKKYDFLSDAEVKGLKGESNISNQPKSLEETVQGAINRAKSVFKNCDLSFGIESGLMSVPQTKTGVMDVCVCAVFDGKEIHLGLSSAFEPPREMVKLMLEKSMDMTEACLAMGLTKNTNIGADNGTIGILTKDRLTRQAYTEQAILTALIHLENSHLF